MREKPEVPVKKTCFAYKDLMGVETCLALKTLDCYLCRFYKTREQAEQDRADARLHNAMKGVGYVTD